ncbi:FtsX-like permease family protein [Micromonospora echinaurantiaca]|uniref:FtsX-like permease family protein n=1 Tax=Micromonospora echinaurantiaca TaxID=47857 RepID=A0A1C5HF43_9ACTN|nr:ABC transporter permease [Micromonospora echinaurantiaca]SCG44669.1 FtsX-like permease family protein [Micromonospora echinaurantiaca]
MLRMVWSQLRNTPGRSLAVFAAVLVATTGFTVLTGAASTSRLVAQGSVDGQFRPSYDILVHPSAPVAGLLDQTRPTAAYGGIGLDQWRRIERIPGVEVAAPLAVLGLADIRPDLRVDVTDQIDRSAERQVVEVAARISGDRGLSRLTTAPTYVYVSRRPLVPLAGQSGRLYVYADGTRVSQSTSAAECPGTGGGGTLEVQPDGRRRQVCQTAVGSFDPDARRTGVSDMQAYQLLADGRFRLASVFTTGRPASAVPATARLEVRLPAVVPVLVAGIDPAAEARLVGLDRAVRQGRYLTGTDAVAPVPPFNRLFPSSTAGPAGRTLPVLAANDLGLDERIDLAVSRLTGPTADRVPGTATEALWTLLRDSAKTPPRAVQHDLAQVYRARLDAALAEQAPLSGILALLRPGPLAYTQQPDGVARVPPRSGADPTDPAIEDVWRDSWLGAGGVGTADPVSLLGQSEWSVTPVGSFAPDAVDAQAAQQALDLYRPAPPVGADARSRDLLGDRPLLPGDDPLGYPHRPPGLVTSLTAAGELYASLGSAMTAAPLSSVRVRVAGIDRFDEVARERVRMVADEIVRQTGLTVEIVLGAATVRSPVLLPAGPLGRPDLTLSEARTRKGVAAEIVTAVDRKNVLLLGLLLVVCALLVGNAVSTAVRVRRRELAVLACVGWPGWRLSLLVLAETTALGLAAGLLGAGLSGPLAQLAGVRVSGTVTLLCVPIAVLLTAAASTLPALRAARTRSAEALQASAAPARRAAARSVAGLAAANLVRAPARALAGAVSLAAGVGAVTLIAAALWAFDDGMVGSLLGQAVSVQVRGVDLVAVGGVLLFGVLGVADVLYLNVRERSAEFATLRAVGWPDAALNRLLIYEALGVGALGCVLGVAAGLGSTALLVGRVDGRLAVLALAVTAAALLLTVLAALVPAILIRRLPTAALLSDE